MSTRTARPRAGVGLRSLFAPALVALAVVLALLTALAPEAGAAVDTDRDGLTDQVERRLRTDPAKPDTDRDRLKDGAEVNTHRTDPRKPDTDRDRLKDGVEVSTHRTNPGKPDTDRDRLPDGYEVANAANPLVAGAGRGDRDRDGLFDDDETDVYRTNPDVFDTDGDGVGDGEEVYLDTDPRVPDGGGERPDRDRDGLFDDDERDVYGTNPDVFDTDGDGVGDGEEVFNGTDPLVRNNDGNGDLDANCLDAEEAEVLRRINQLRAAHGAAPVRVSGTLNAAAEAHSRDMGVRGFFSHTNPDGQTVKDRIVAHGYQLGNPWALGENIHRVETGAAAYAGWEASAGHHANMVNANFEAIGIARVFVPGSPHGWYWTTTHANRFDAAPAC